MMSEIIAILGLFIGIMYTPATLAAIISNNRETSEIQVTLLALGYCSFISAMWIIK